MVGSQKIFSQPLFIKINPVSHGGGGQIVHPDFYMSWEARISVRLISLLVTRSCKKKSGTTVELGRIFLRLRLTHGGMVEVIGGSSAICVKSKIYSKWHYSTICGKFQVGSSSILEGVHLRQYINSSIIYSNATVRIWLPSD